MLFNGNIRFVYNNHKYGFSLNDIWMFRLLSLILLVIIGLIISLVISTNSVLLYFFIVVKLFDLLQEWRLAQSLHLKSYFRYFLVVAFKVVLFGFLILSLLLNFRAMLPFLYTVIGIFALGIIYIIYVDGRKISPIKVREYFRFISIGFSSILDSFVPQLVKYMIVLNLAVTYLGYFQNTILFIVSFGFIFSSMASTWIAEFSCDDSKFTFKSKRFINIGVLSVLVGLISAILFYGVWKYLYYKEIPNNSVFNIVFLIVLICSFFYNTGVVLSYVNLARGRVKKVIKINIWTLIFGVLVFIIVKSFLVPFIVGPLVFLLMNVARTLLLSRRLQ